ncbi:5-methylcytosine-specific restriction endonuclease system specificity protein McrC [Staphylococcus equorum]|uniref:5-methylcytosine-specific restriction endonuclease system specificity protein McrC n=1 Tax=Staphylococcus equorum TaxID=246432 RepID=UPI0020CE9F08|nr:5-methylcytosine-specific restriction endonuclease system specificity protein McrC [Staphylococcus equorum]MEB7759015.1 5-methylcytosine-specific restriction endonuclease system specificity protein McrC [Staphylococcus equorum]MEB7761598.1 5-methylcytosine-specific restriction endonuclease system specificity protein McrC [Staphylococcus equorum]UTT56190.1 5-methylcytosine-specific restriction endonuclease system specificity protein McrC [Staphylococcus equorum]
MIAIKNIYYMLSYAYKVLNENGYRKVATEDFENAIDLYAAILIKGVSIQLKRGLHHEYVEEKETLKMVRGKINITESIKNLDIMNHKLNCSYDEFSINIYMNKIIKTTMILLLKAEISKERKKKIKKLLLFFDKVDVLDRHNINWNLQFTRNNQTYKMLTAICYLIIKGLLQSKKDGSSQLMDYSDEQQLSRLFEKFIFEYYKKEFPQLTVTAPHIPWMADDGIMDMLPVMKTDIILSYKNEYLIIDTKYYAKTLQNNYGTHKIHSGNLYQIFTYVKNLDIDLKEKSAKVSGMLLYAKTEEKIVPDNNYQMGGNQISVKTLDLNCDFIQVSEQLNQIALEYFKI